MFQVYYSHLLLLYILRYHNNNLEFISSILISRDAGIANADAKPNRKSFVNFEIFLDLQNILYTPRYGFRRPRIESPSAPQHETC